ncbi:hypothetical protein M3Y95_00390300 [Aphelenchoides besseyi]|nr:hypothetical protein M3Y95_00390300 [Aphelenchoides besseyi]
MNKNQFRFMQTELAIHKRFRFIFGFCFQFERSLSTLLVQMSRLFVLAMILLMFEAIEAYSHSNDANYNKDSDDTTSGTILVSLILICCSSLCPISSIFGTIFFLIVGTGAIVGRGKNNNAGQGGQIITPAPNQQPARTVAGEDDLETANSCFEFTA